MKPSKTQKPKIYKIKVPVYISELFESSDLMFGGVTHQELVNRVKNKIDIYNANIKEITNTRKNKTFEKHIKGITYQEVPFSTYKCLLLRVTAFTTNYTEGFFEETQKIPLTKDAKIGSDNNFILVCPLVYSDDKLPNTYKSQWIFLLYEDPNKENADVVQTAKLVFNKVIGISVKNIKLNSVIESIRKTKVTPIVSLKFTSVKFDTDSEPKYKTFLVEEKQKTISELTYQDLPSDDTVELISKTEGFKQAIKSIIFGKKEYRITQTIDEETNKFTQVVEEIYNSEVIITEDELKNELYEPNFVISKLKPILEDYLKNG